MNAHVLIDLMYDLPIECLSDLILNFNVKYLFPYPHI